MAFEFMLPDIGEGLTEATVVRWLVPVGAPVSLDQPIVELETDKAVIEIPSPRAGVILHQGAPEGAVIQVGSLLVVVGEADEIWSPATETPRSRRSGPEAAPIVGTLEEADVAPLSPQALPLVRRLAAALGVDLREVVGTGPGGRITRSDVEAAAAGGGGVVERVRMSPTRIAIARNLTRSWQETPHVTTFASADPTSIFAERTRLAAETGEKVPLEALLIALLVPVLHGHPEFNASLDGETIVYRRYYDIGFAVDTPGGLLVAVVRGADGRSARELGTEIARLAAAARERTLAPDELRGATFTVSNIGAVGGGFGTPIIPLGTTAILSVGRAEERPVIRNGAIVIGREMPLSLSYDHRVIDGAGGRAFMADVVSAFEGAGG
jgi:pyruvate dehydrogenase E2 component (dihydrolipoamide acetyltransferase)